MNDPSKSQSAPATSAVTGGPNLAATVVRVAWYAILIGFALEIILLIIAASFGNVQGVRKFVADLVQKISWSFIVCVGLAFGSAATKMRTQLMGLAGLLAAPAAFIIARALHKSAVQVLAITAAAPAGPSPFTLALIKGIEYGCLGAVLGWMSRRPWGGAKAHAWAGLTAGLIFGTITLTLMVRAAAQPLGVPILLSRGVNELLFPVGCSLAIYAAETLGKRASQ